MEARGNRTAGTARLLSRIARHSPRDQRHRPEVRIVLPLDVLLAIVRAVERGIAVDPGDDLDELLSGEPGLARLLANPLDQPASM